MEANSLLLRGVWLVPLLLACPYPAPAQPEVPAPKPDVAASPSRAQMLPTPLPASVGAALTLNDLIRMTLEQNPRLQQANFAIEAARGRALQAGLYPNPFFSVTGDELGDRTGPAGIWTAPNLSQEIVTAHKLTLNQSAAFKEVDQAALTLAVERYDRFGAVRAGFFEVLALQQRIQILADLVKLAQESVELTRKRQEARQAARLDVAQLEVALERFRADYEAAQRQLVPALERLAAAVGILHLPCAALAGTLDLSMPEYDLCRAQDYMLEVHPQVQHAKVGVDRAQLLLRRAQVEPIPNVTVSANFVRQSQNRSSDWGVGISLPVPVWNKNQGNIQAAHAQIGEWVQEIGRVKNDLANRLATAFGDYAAARKRAEQYQAIIVPRAEETYRLSLAAYRAGGVEYLNVFEAQRVLAEARLEANRSLGEMWQAASRISALLVEDHWPPPAHAPAVESPKGDKGAPDVKKMDHREQASHDEARMRAVEGR